MRNICLTLLTIGLFFLPGQTLADTVSGKITMHFDLSGHRAKEDVRLWIPYPVSDENQEIGAINISGPASTAVYTDSRNGTPMLYAMWPAGAKEKKLDFSFDVKRNEVSKRDFPKYEAKWDPSDYKLYLEATSLAPLDGDIGKLAAKITSGKKTVLEKARAIYDWTVENTFRDPETKGCGKGDVCELIKRPGGKCTDISSIFVALARAAGVPARDVFGIRQGKKTGEDITKWQHCWAEFYLPGYGWVPVDPADVRKMMLKENVGLDNKKTKEFREYYWGGVDAYRVRLGEGRDLVLNPPQEGAPLNYLMYPFAQVDGKTLDWLEPESFRYTIEYTSMDK